MNKRVCWLLIIFSVVLIMSCEKNFVEIEEVNYTVIEHKYCENYSAQGQFYESVSGYDKGYYISYPQIENLENKDIEDMINEKMKDIAMSNIYEYYSPEETVVKTTYTIILSTDIYFNVKFVLSFFEKYQAYPNIEIRTLHFNLTTGEILDTND